MPTPDRTSLDEIVAAARHILEADGLAGLTMQAVANRVAVRAPSLYKRVKSRDILIGLVAESAVAELGARLEAVQVTDAADSRSTLIALAREFRRFAHENSAAYHLIFAMGPEATRPPVELLARASDPVLRIAAELAGEEHGLAAARTITAWAHGFVSMELAGAFQLGGSIDDAFEFGITSLAEALAASTVE